MTFKAGKWYRDAVGRRWKVLRLVHQGNYDLMVVRMRIRLNRHPLYYAPALTDEETDNKTATVLLNEFWFTTIYDAEAKE